MNKVTFDHMPTHRKMTIAAVCDTGETAFVGSIDDSAPSQLYLITYTSVAKADNPAIVWSKVNFGSLPVRVDCWVDLNITAVEKKAAV